MSSVISFLSSILSSSISILIGSSNKLSLLGKSSKKPGSVFSYFNLNSKSFSSEFKSIFSFNSSLIFFSSWSKSNENLSSNSVSSISIGSGLIVSLFIKSMLNFSSSFFIIFSLEFIPSIFSFIFKSVVKLSISGLGKSLTIIFSSVLSISFNIKLSSTFTCGFFISRSIFSLSSDFICLIPSILGSICTKNFSSSLT